MDAMTYKLGMLSGRVGAAISIPVVITTGWSLSSVERIGEYLVLPSTTLSVGSLFASLILLLTVLYWRCEAGHGWKDTAIAAIASLPFLVLVHFMDPLGASRLL